MRVLALILALFCVAGGAYGQSKSKPDRQPPSAQSAQPSAAGKRGTDEIPLSVKVIPRQPSKEEAAKEEADRLEKTEIEKKVAFETQRVADYTWWLAAFTIVLACVAIGQAGLFIWQLSYMRQGMIDASLAANAASEAAKAAREQVGVAKAQIEVTKIGIFDLERAYLDASPSDIKTQFVTNLRGVYQPGDPMEVVAKVGLKNSGKTRAVITQVYGEFRTGTGLEEYPTYNPLMGRNYPTDLSVAANEALDFMHDFRTRDVTEQFFFGFIAYTDIFKNTHTSRFCMRIFPSPQHWGDARRQLAGNNAWREYD